MRGLNFILGVIDGFLLGVNFMSNHYDSALFIGVIIFVILAILFYQDINE